MGETNLVNWNYKLSIIYPPLTSISSYVNFSSPALYVSIHWSFKQLALVVCYINWYGIYMPLFNKAYCIDACCTIICVSFVNQTLSLGWHLSIRDYKRPLGIRGSGALPAHCLCQHLQIWILLIGIEWLKGLSLTGVNGTKILVQCMAGWLDERSVLSVFRWCRSYW